MYEAPTAPPERPRAYRPRAKLFAHGAARLSQSELLELLLAPGHRVRATTARLLRAHGLSGLAELTPGAWRASGLGPASAARLCAVFELGRRAYGRRPEHERPRLTNPREVFEQVRHIAAARKEHLIGLYLDAQNGLLHRETLSMGGLNTTRTHPREILYPAVTHLALGFILAHNHPSGCLEPSGEDLQFTGYVRNAADLLGIELYDHLIVARGGYVSLRDRGLI